MTDLQQEETELLAAFAELDPQRIHATVLGTWGPDAYVLARDTETRRRLLKILKLRNAKGLVFNRQAGPAGAMADNAPLG
jgi:hypothetical protein